VVRPKGGQREPPTRRRSKVKAAGRGSFRSSIRSDPRAVRSVAASRVAGRLPGSLGVGRFFPRRARVGVTWVVRAQMRDRTPRPLSIDAGVAIP
jgi:hypothetical protein